MHTLAASTLVLFALLACKRGHEQTPAEKAEEEARVSKEIDRCNKRLATLASLGPKLKTLPAPTSMTSGVLTGTRNGYANFDVLLADELAEPNELPKIRIRLDHYFAECAKNVKAKTVSITDCSSPYVVVLKPYTYQTAEVSGSEYTPGKVDAAAYVFDMSNGELVGGGRITAKTPSSITTKSSTAESDLNDKLGQAAFESLATELNVKEK